MNIVLISSLLGVFLLKVVLAEEPPQVGVSVWPQGLNIYLEESVLLHCSMESNSSSVWTYRWFRHRPDSAPTPNPRHLVSGDSYSITAVTREDGGSYQCRAERGEGNISSVMILSQPVVLRVLDVAPASLTVTPSSRQMFRGDRFSVHCSGSHSNSSWTLRRFSLGQTDRSRAFHTDRCSALGGGVGTDRPHTCVFTAGRETGGLYWCEGAEGRSNAVSISVSDGSVILRTPASPVLEGSAASLLCQYRTGSYGKTIFFKDGVKVNKSTSSISNTEIKMTIDNVTKEDEGFYKCSPDDRRVESPESWLSVWSGRGKEASTDEREASTGSWVWIFVPCILLLLLTPLSVWLIHHYRYQTFCTRSCWPSSKMRRPAVQLPATKQDVTEVQWDLSWMEMSDLLDKHLYPGT